MPHRGVLLGGKLTGWGVVLTPRSRSGRVRAGAVSLCAVDHPRERSAEREKQAAALAAAALVGDGQLVGLGTGSTVAHLLPALAARRLAIRCVATSPATERTARALGLDVGPFDSIARLDIAIDGADQVDPAGWLIKGGGGAHLREKIVAAAAERFVVIVSSDKAVEHLHPPVPLELLRFGLDATLARLGDVRLRDAPPSADGNVIADYHGALDDPAALTAWLEDQPGVLGHGIFAPALTSDVLIATGDRVVHRRIG
jgi:ribose 5-phosphate isomerase A